MRLKQTLYDETSIPQKLRELEIEEERRNTSSSEASPHPQVTKKSLDDLKRN